MLYICTIRNKQIEIMTTKNTTPEKQQNLINFAKELGITMENLKRMYKDPKKASVLNIIAEGL